MSLTTKLSLSGCRPKILITRSWSEAGELLQKHFDVEYLKDGDSGTTYRDKMIELMKGKFGLLCDPKDKIDEDIIKAGVPTLRVVSTLGVGVDHVDTKALKRNKVRFGNCPGVNTEATAELTVALLLATSRRLRELSNFAKTGSYAVSLPQNWRCQGLDGSTVGIVGYGSIGNSVARKLKTFSVKQILYTSRQEKVSGTEIGAVRTDLETLLRSSDFVIITMALTPETRGFIGRHQIGLMKKTAIIVNTSRGGLIDQEALVEALEEKRILAAGLDVTEPEPLPVDHPLLKLDNCEISAHSGSLTVKGISDLERCGAQNIIAVLKESPMPGEVPLL